MLLDSYIFNFLRREVERDVQRCLLWFSCALLFVYMLQFIIKTIVEYSRLPPGPYGVYPFGILKFMGSVKHKSFMKLAETYGPLFSCKLGQQLHIVISDYKLIREFLKRETLTGRPKTPLIEVLNGAGELSVTINSDRVRLSRLFSTGKSTNTKEAFFLKLQIYKQKKSL